MGEADDDSDRKEDAFSTDGLITGDEAITAAVAATDGTPRSWKLERGDAARIVFEVSVIASGGDDRDVYVDAQSGQTVEVDD